MIKEQELKDRRSHEFYEFIYKMCGKDYLPLYSSELNFEIIHFPLLIHRAVAGWNLFNENIREWIEVDKQQVSLFMHGVYRYEFKKYAPHILTSAECAMLHCLFDVYYTKEFPLARQDAESLS